MTRRWNSLVGWGVYLLLVAVTGALLGSGGMASAMGTLRDFLFAGLYLGFPLAALTCGDLWRSGTLGNELTVGLPRSRIYFGKLLASLMVGVVLFCATILLFLLSAMPWSGQLPEGESRTAMASLLGGVLISLPRYVGCVALAHCLCFTLRANGLAPVVYFLYISLGELLLGATKFHNMGYVGEAMNAFTNGVRPFLLGSAYFTYGNLEVQPPQPGVWISWLTGLVWLVVSCAAGMAVFSRREIK